MVVAELLTKLGFQVDPRELNRGITHAKSALTELKGFIAKLGIGYAAYKIGKSVLGTARELESLNVQLKTMVGPDKATTLFKGITDYAKTTAFYVKDVTGAVSTMIQGMVAVPDIMPKIAQLGDIAMTSDQLNRLAYAYAQVNRQGYMTNYEARRFLQGGNFGVFQQFAMSEAVQQGRMKKGQEVQKGSDLDTQLRARQGELFGMAKKHQFTVGMLDQAISYATTQGGIFYRHQLEQVKTFEGAWSNMWDVLSINTGLAVQKLFPIMKQLMIAVTSIDLSWMSGAFERLGASIQFVGHMIGKSGFLEAWVAFKEAFHDFLKELPGGSGELKTFGWVLGKVLTAAMIIATGFVELATACAKMYKWLKENKWAVIGLGVAFSVLLLPKILMGLVAFKQMASGLSTLGLLFRWFREDAVVTTMIVLEKFATGLVGVFRTLMIFVTMFKANALMAMETGVRSLGAALMSTAGNALTMATSLSAARVGMNKFFAESRVGMFALSLATGWAIQKIFDLAIAIKESKDADLHIAAVTWRANRQIAQTELKTAQKKLAGAKDPFAKMEAQTEVDLHAKELAYLNAHPIGEPAADIPDPMANVTAQLAEMQKSIDKLYDPTKKTADNTDPSRRGGFDEASLLMTAIRGRLPSEIMNGVAEYD